MSAASSLLSLVLDPGSQQLVAGSADGQVRATLRAFAGGLGSTTASGSLLGPVPAPRALEKLQEQTGPVAGWGWQLDTFGEMRR